MYGPASLAILGGVAIFILLSLFHLTYWKYWNQVTKVSVTIQVISPVSVECRQSQAVLLQSSVRFVWVRVPDKVRDTFQTEGPEPVILPANVAAPHPPVGIRTSLKEDVKQIFYKI